MVCLAPRDETDQVLNGLCGTAKPQCRDRGEEGGWCGSGCRVIHHSVGTAMDVADLALPGSQAFRRQLWLVPLIDSMSWSR